MIGVGDWNLRRGWKLLVLGVYGKRDELVEVVLSVETMVFGMAVEEKRSFEGVITRRRR